MLTSFCLSPKNIIAGTFRGTTKKWNVYIFLGLLSTLPERIATVRKGKRKEKISNVERGKKCHIPKKVEHRYLKISL